MERKLHLIFEFPNVPPKAYPRKKRNGARSGANRSSDNVSNSVARSDSGRSIQASSPTTPPSQEIKEKIHHDEDCKPPYSPVTKFSSSETVTTKYVPNKDIPYRRSREEIKRILRERDKQRARTLEISNPYSGSQSSYNAGPSKSSEEYPPSRKPDTTKLNRSHTFQDATASTRAKTTPSNLIDDEVASYAATKGSSKNVAYNKSRNASLRASSVSPDHLKPVPSYIQHKADGVLFSESTYEERQNDIRERINRPSDSDRTIRPSSPDATGIQVQPRPIIPLRKRNSNQSECSSDDQRKSVTFDKYVSYDIADDKIKDKSPVSSIGRSFNKGIMGKLHSVTKKEKRSSWASDDFSQRYEDFQPQRRTRMDSDGISIHSSDSAVSEFSAKISNIRNHVEQRFSTSSAEPTLTDYTIDNSEFRGNQVSYYGGETSSLNSLTSYDSSNEGNKKKFFNNKSEASMFRRPFKAIRRYVGKGKSGRSKSDLDFQAVDYTYERANQTYDDILVSNNFPSQTKFTEETNEQFDVEENNNNTNKPSQSRVCDENINRKHKTLVERTSSFDTKHHVLHRRSVQSNVNDIIERYETMEGQKHNVIRIAPNQWIAEREEEQNKNERISRSDTDSPIFLTVGSAYASVAHNEICSDPNNRIIPSRNNLELPLNQSYERKSTASPIDNELRYQKKPPNIGDRFLEHIQKQEKRNIGNIQKSRSTSNITMDDIDFVCGKGNEGVGVNVEVDRRGFRKRISDKISSYGSTDEIYAKCKTTVQNFTDRTFDWKKRQSADEEVQNGSDIIGPPKPPRLFQMGKPYQGNSATELDSPLGNKDFRRFSSVDSECDFIDPSGRIDLRRQVVSEYIPSVDGLSSTMDKEVPFKPQTMEADVTVHRAEYRSSEGIFQQVGPQSVRQFPVENRSLKTAETESHFIPPWRSQSHKENTMLPTIRITSPEPEVMPIDYNMHNENSLKNRVSYKNQFSGKSSVNINPTQHLVESRSVAQISTDRQEKRTINHTSRNENDVFINKTVQEVNDYEECKNTSAEMSDTNNRKELIEIPAKAKAPLPRYQFDSRELNDLKSNKNNIPQRISNPVVSSSTSESTYIANAMKSFPSSDSEDRYSRLRSLSADCLDASPKPTGETGRRASDTDRPRVSSPLTAARFALLPEEERQETATYMVNSDQRLLNTFFDRLMLENNRTNRDLFKEKQKIIEQSQFMKDAANKDGGNFKNNVRSTEDRRRASLIDFRQKFPSENDLSSNQLSNEVSPRLTDEVFDYESSKYPSTSPINSVKFNENNNDMRFTHFENEFPSVDHNTRNPSGEALEKPKRIFVETDIRNCLVLPGFSNNRVPYNVPFNMNGPPNVFNVLPMSHRHVPLMRAKKVSRKTELEAISEKSWSSTQDLQSLAGGESTTESDKTASTVIHNPLIAAVSENNDEQDQLSPKKSNDSHPNSSSSEDDVDERSSVRKRRGSLKKNAKSKMTKSSDDITIEDASEDTNSQLNADSGVQESGYSGGSEDDQVTLAFYPCIHCIDHCSP